MLPCCSRLQRDESNQLHSNCLSPAVGSDWAADHDGEQTAHKTAFQFFLKLFHTELPSGHWVQTQPQTRLLKLATTQHWRPIPRISHATAARWKTAWVLTVYQNWLNKMCSDITGTNEKHPAAMWKGEEEEPVDGKLLKSLLTDNMLFLGCVYNYLEIAHCLC